MNICTKEENAEKPDGKLRVLRAITQHSLGNSSPEVGSVTLASRWPWHLVGLGVTLDSLVARAIAVMVFSHSASPQHLADRSLIRILGNLYGTISGNLFESGHLGGP